MIRESCVLCACKHIAQARILLLEAGRGYPEHYFFALGHLAEAEDELHNDHLELAKAIRFQRKCLEEDKEYKIHFGPLIISVSETGQAETEEKVKDLEKEFEGKSPEDLAKWWKEIQS